MKLIIFSKDRAAQLELLLRSMEKFGLDKCLDVYIIHTYSDAEFARGYVELIKQYQYEGPFTFTIEQPDVKSQVLGLIRDDNFGFSADDNYFWREPPRKDFDNLVENVTAFSLRLGFNTVRQDPFNDVWQAPLSIYDDEGDTIRWDASLYHPLHNYGFPFAFDLHLFNRTVVLPLLKSCQFKTPNQLETEMVKNGEPYPKFIRSFKESCAVNNPITNMSQITQSLELDLREINRRFCDGERLNYKVDKIIACHQVLPIEWS
jgi:hypothetical protein